jgi:3,4-dihydroxy 2-butanone 4-phosphate synthase/GTP cyclohydrolase II
LAEWLSEQKITRTAFAVRIGVSPSFITLLCNGTSYPGRRVAKAIFRETHGTVTSQDFFTEPQDANRSEATSCPSP